MSDGTSIEWSQASWNPVLGCDRVSDGCTGCYAIPQARMRAANPNPKIAAAFAGLTERTPERLDWTGRVNQLPARLNQPLKWRKPRRIFVNSLSDMFHAKIEADFIAQVFAVMSLAEQHIFQMLTKRHARMRSLLNEPDFVAVVDDHRERIRPGCGDFIWPLPNLHLGVSVEDQHWADIRIPALLATPAAVRWVSAEPLLGPLNLWQWMDPSTPDVDCDVCGDERFADEIGVGHNRDVYDAAGENVLREEWCSGPSSGAQHRRLNWIVTGGESGPDARPMHPDWARSLRDQCQAARVSYFFKQWGDWIPEALGAHVITEHTARSARYADLTGGHRPANIGARNGAATCHRVGKKAAGRELDGRLWSEYPQPAEVSR